MKILITGSRNWKWKGPIEKLIMGFGGAGNIFVFGDCPTGADAIAKQVCKDLQYAYNEHKADWDVHGKVAGPLRNGKMVDWCNPKKYSGETSICFAFRSEGASDGTDDALYQANIAGIPTYVIRKLPNLAEINYVVEGINFSKKARNHGNK